MTLPFCLSLSPFSMRKESQLSQTDPRDALRHVHCVVHKAGRSV